MAPAHHDKIMTENLPITHLQCDTFSFPFLWLKFSWSDSVQPKKNDPVYDLQPVVCSI